LRSPYNLTYEDLADELSSRGVDIDKPNFLNNTEFIEYLGKEPKFIETYACFVQRRFLSNSYLRHSQNVIEIASRVLHNELISDGRQGACIDASGVLSQSLEMLGIWSYQVVGSLTVSFPKSGIDPLYFYSRDSGDFAAAHSWIVAPPFAIVDITISTQPYRAGVNALLPDVVLQRDVQNAEYTIEDLCSPDYLAAAQFAGIDKSNMEKDMYENLADFHSAFRPSRLTHHSTELKYIPMGIVSFDGALDVNKSLCLNGRSGFAIYNDLILPKVEEQSSR
jgi:hypothetical protein